MVENAEQQNWGYCKLLLHLCEAEAGPIRQERKRERLLTESGLPQGKTLRQPGRSPTAGQSAAATAHPPGRRVCGASREPVGFWIAEAIDKLLLLCKSLIIKKKSFD